MNPRGSDIAGLVLVGALGPIYLSYWFVRSFLASRRFRAAADREQPTPPTTALEKASNTSLAVQRGLAPTMRALPATAIACVIGGVLWGSLAYTILVQRVFLDVERYVATEATSPELAIYAADPRAGDEAEIAATLLTAAGVSSANDDNVARLSAEILALRSAGRAGVRVPMLPLAVAVAFPNGGTCAVNATCQGEMAFALSRLLVGETERNANIDRQRVLSARDGARQDNKGIQRDGWFAVGLYGRTAPMTPSAAASLLLDRKECSTAGGETDICKLARHLVQSAMDDSGTRSKLTFGVGFIHGLGRLIVFVLLSCIVSALLYRACALLPLEAQAWTILEKLRTLSESDAWKGKFPSIADRRREMGLLAEYFDTQHPDLYQADRTKDQKATTADPRLHPIAGLLAANSRAFAAGSSSALDVADELARGELNRWRETINVFVTFFPVIGFSATLMGLISAFAGADRIAIYSGLERAAAIREMVTELSSCFATTFLALGCMAGLTLWSMRQQFREGMLVSYVGKVLETVLPATDETNACCSEPISQNAKVVS